MGSNEVGDAQLKVKCVISAPLVSQTDFPDNLSQTDTVGVDWSKCFYLQLKIKTTKSYLWIKQYIQAKLVTVHVFNSLINAKMFFYVHYYISVCILI